MTEQEIEQARADVDQLDIEQLRCGVLLQLLHIEALKKERDRLQYEVDAIPDIKEERDALALDVDQWRVDYHELRLEHGQKAVLSLSEAITALREAGVQ
jgi:hypothetical protein